MRAAVSRWRRAKRTSSASSRSSLWYLRSLVRDEPLDRAGDALGHASTCSRGVGLRSICHYLHYLCADCLSSGVGAPWTSSAALYLRAVPPYQRYFFRTGRHV